MTKKIMIATFSLVVAALLLAVFMMHRRDSYCELVVEFTYSRTQPCNADYYNYAFSINPLRDLLMYWNAENGATRTGFQNKVKDHLMACCGGVLPSNLRVPLDKLCQGVVFELISGECVSHPIRCKMTVRGGGVEAAKLLARAIKETILQENELANLSTSWKATMDKGCAFKNHERELKKLKRMLIAPGMNVAEREGVMAKILSAERLTEAAKLEWEAAIKAYREKWDSSIVFLDDNICKDAY